MTPTKVTDYLAEYAYNNAESPFPKDIWISTSGTEYSGELADVFAQAENAIKLLVSEHVNGDLNSFGVAYNLNEVLEAIGVIIKDLHEYKI